MSTKKKYTASSAFRPPVNDDVAFLLNGEPEETVQRARERNLPLAHLPVTVIAPDTHQVRRLPHPQELTRMASSGDQGAQALLDGLHELGTSMQQHGQIQPVIVYADSDPDDPQITHRLLSGQRRWSGALLVGMDTLWAVEVPRPTEVMKILHQHEENERRSGFTDIERAWAMVRLKDAIQQEAGGEVPWSIVEEQLHLSTQRRQDLMRLLRFDAAGQGLILRYGWSEWVLRPVHMAINAGTIDSTAATQLLHTLAGHTDVTASTVAAEVEAWLAQHSATLDADQDESVPAAAPGPAPQTALLKKTIRLRKGLDQMRASIETLTDPDTRAALRQELEQVMHRITDLCQQLALPAQPETAIPDAAQEPDKEEPSPFSPEGLTGPTQHPDQLHRFHQSEAVEGGG